MLVSFTWPVEEPAPGSSGSEGGGAGAAALVRVLSGAFDPYGTGIVRPFRRGSADFVTASGIPEVMSCVGQLLGTDLGSIPWRPRFGTRLTRLRHKSNSPALAAIARVDVDDAIRQWEPRATITDLDVEQVQSPGHTSAGANVLEAAVTVQIGAQSKTLRVPI